MTAVRLRFFTSVISAIEVCYCNMWILLYHHLEKKVMKLPGEVHENWKEADMFCCSMRTMFLSFSWKCLTLKTSGGLGTSHCILFSMSQHLTDDYIIEVIALATSETG